METDVYFLRTEHQQYPTLANPILKIRVLTWTVKVGRGIITKRFLKTYIKTGRKFIRRKFKLLSLSPCFYTLIVKMDAEREFSISFNVSFWLSIFKDSATNSFTVYVEILILNTRFASVGYFWCSVRKKNTSVSTCDTNGPVNLYM